MSAWRREYGRPAFWFLLPALALLGMFVVWPMLRSAWWSLHDVDLLASSRQRWMGFDQYSDLLSDARFRGAFANTALFALMVVPVQTLLALLLVSGLFVTIALSRAGVRHFWLPQTTPAPRLRVIECAPYSAFPIGRRSRSSA